MEYELFDLKCTWTEPQLKVTIHFDLLDSADSKMETFTIPISEISSPKFYNFFIMLYTLYYINPQSLGCIEGFSYIKGVCQHFLDIHGTQCDWSDESSCNDSSEEDTNEKADEKVNEKVDEKEIMCPECGAVPMDGQYIEYPIHPDETYYIDFVTFKYIDGTEKGIKFPIKGQLLEDMLVKMREAQYQYNSNDEYNFYNHKVNSRKLFDDDPDFGILLAK